MKGGNAMTVKTLTYSEEAREKLQPAVQCRENPEKPLLILMSPNLQPNKNEVSHV